mgnify:CR=1 FL=1
MNNKKCVDEENEKHPKIVKQKQNRNFREEMKSMILTYKQNKSKSRIDTNQ